MNVFGIGLPEMAVIAAIALVVFGPKRLPELGRTLGRTLRSFQSASQDFEKEVRGAISPSLDASIEQSVASGVAAADGDRVASGSQLDASPASGSPSGS